MAKFPKIGVQIQFLRGGISLEEVAKKTGFSVDKIKKIESGKTENPKFCDVQKIMDAIGYKVYFHEKQTQRGYYKFISQK